jgi:hypothetical protein
MNKPLIRKSDVPGGAPGLQNQRGADKVPGGFDSYLFRQPQLRFNMIFPI